MSVINTKTQFFRCNGLISVSKLKSKISEHILELAVINTRINDMEDEIIKGYHLSDIPKDTSKLSDESLIAFVEKRQKLFDVRDSINNKIDKLKSECTKIENGILIEYYFSKLEIMIPIKYVLREDSLLVSLDVKEIAEGNKYKVTKVSLAPFMTSVKNTESKDYLFLFEPSRSPL